jgi:hypothetical protein
MLKKMLVVIGAMLVLASASYATTPSGYTGASSGVDVEEWDGHANIKGESWSWPAEYKYMPVCIIPVKMDIGFWVRVEKCKDAVIKMQQTAIRKYSGSTDLKVVCNVAIDLAVDFAATVNGLGDKGASVTPNHLEVPGGTITVSAWVNNFDIANSKDLAVGTCIKVGEVTLKVRPAVTPQLSGAC